MHSAELATYPTEWERLIDTSVASTDMTLIYNAHGTPENAVASVEHVQPDSVVFIEGFSIGQARVNSVDEVPVEPPYRSALLKLSEQRLKYGKGDPNYEQYKEAILFSIDENASKYVPKDVSDFTLHSLAEIKALLNKDCLIFYADYRDLNIEQEDDSEKTSDYNRQFHELVNGAESISLAAITGGSIGGALHDLVLGVKDEMEMHDEREWQAISRSLTMMGRLEELGTLIDAAGLRRSEDGKMVAYTIYGTAHARSLTQKFVAQGVNPKIAIVEQIAEHQYLDVTLESGYINRHRRIGHAAFSTIAYRLTHEFVAPALVEDAYRHLGFLNAVSDGERLSFLISCAQIQKLLGHGDRKTAEEEYLALLRSFMPQSTMSKPPKGQTTYAMPATA